MCLFHALSGISLKKPRDSLNASAVEDSVAKGGGGGEKTVEGGVVVVAVLTKSSWKKCSYY